MKANDFDIGCAVSGAGDNDRANMWSGTPWLLTGDWENVIPYSSPGGAGLPGVDLDLACWIAAFRNPEKGDDTEGDAEEVDLASLDYVFGALGARQ